MRIERREPPRTFSVGASGAIEISDTGSVYLEPDEQVTFVTPAGKRLDFTAKSWGFYATPSVNGRLVSEGFKTALVRNDTGRYYVMVVDASRLEEFEAYLLGEKSTVVEWLDEL